MSANERGIAPVRKSITVPGAPESVFERFTAGMADWWPLETHSLGRADAETVVFEPREGGRVYERNGEGETILWGTVRVWDPPRRFVMSWHPGRAESTAQELEVRFSAADEGRRIDLTHGGWERLTDRPSESRDEYDGGWDVVLGRFVGRDATVD